METARVWEIRVGVHGTESQVRDLVERIERLLCPDPDHAPPCPIPWSSAHGLLSEQDAADTYPELLEQARVERRT